MVSIRFNTSSRLLSESLMANDNTLPKSSYKPNFRPAKADEKKYWEKLGEFISWFSLVEQDLQLMLWRIADVKTPIAQVIFSGARVKDGISFTRRIHEASGTPMCEILDAALSHLSTINDVRNTIVHHGASFLNQEELEVSNRLFAFNERVLNRHLIKLSNLEDLVEDLAQVALILRYTLDEIAPHPNIILGDWRNEFGPWGSWRYKPLSPKNTHRKIRTNRESRRHPPKSSPK